MDALGKDYVITAWFATTSWRRPTRISSRASPARWPTRSAWAAKNPAKCIDILSKQFKVDPAHDPVDGLATFPTKITPELIAVEVTMTARYGKFPPSPRKN